MKHDEIGTWAAIASSFAAVVSISVAIWSARSAKRSAEASSNNYQLNAAKEWADRCGGIRFEFTLAKFAYEDASSRLKVKFSKAGALSTSGYSDLDTIIKAHFDRALAIEKKYLMHVVPSKVLAATDVEAFSLLIAELELDRSELRVLRSRLETLRSDWS
jgi:hypothetical protein